ncbi:MAG: hypothetical protein ABH956_01840 [Candidatus Nealsonbacteria bacterium]
MEPKEKKIIKGEEDVYFEMMRRKNKKNPQNSSIHSEIQQPEIITETEKRILVGIEPK